MYMNAQKKQIISKVFGVFTFIFNDEKRLQFEAETEAENISIINFISLYWLHSSRIYFVEIISMWGKVRELWMMLVQCRIVLCSFIQIKEKIKICGAKKKRIKANAYGKNEWNPDRRWIMMIRVDLSGQ